MLILIRKATWPRWTLFNRIGVGINTYFSDELDDVLEDIQEYGIREESWHVVAPETEKEQIEEEIEGAEIEYNPMNAFESITQQRRAANFDTGCTSFHYEMLSEEMSTSEWIECILSLNQKQYSLHQCIAVHCRMGIQNDSLA